MAAIIVSVKDPYPVGLPEILTAAQVETQLGSRSFGRSQGKVVRGGFCDCWRIT